VVLPLPIIGNSIIKQRSALVLLKLHTEDPWKRNIRPALSLGWGIKAFLPLQIHIQLLIESIRIYMIDKFWLSL
jgi:hypothetical protein